MGGRNRQGYEKHKIFIEVWMSTHFVKASNAILMNDFFEHFGNAVMLILKSRAKNEPMRIYIQGEMGGGEREMKRDKQRDGER